MQKIIFISHNIYGFECLKILLETIKLNKLDYIIDNLITRKKTSFLSDQCFEFKNFCNENKIKYFEVSNIKSEESILFFENNKSDLILVLGWTQLLPNKVLNSTNLALGTHPSILPNNIGNAVIPWHILKNEKYGGFTLFELKEEVDSGEIFYQSKFILDNECTSNDYYNKFINEGKECIKNYLFEILRTNQKIKLNLDIKETICCKRIYNDSQINFDDTSENIKNLIFAMNGPYPNAFGFLKRGSKYYNINILNVEITELEIEYNAINGTVIFSNNNYYVKTSDSYLKLLEYYSEEDIKLIHNDRFNNKMTPEIFKLIKKNKNKIINKPIENINNSNVLVVVAHPDDEVYGCGGYIKKLSKVNNVYVLILTEGCSIQYNSTELVNIKKEECKKVKEILNIKEYFFADLKDMKLDTYPEVEITKSIEKYVKKINPYMILTHNNVDLNRDHTTINKSVQVACRPGSGVKSILSFEVLSTTELSSKSFKPNKFVNIENEIDYKLKAVEAYKTELRKYPHGRCTESVIALSKFRGVCSNYNYAEAFCVIKSYED
jgi:methionyl-tRNA formyltransferase/LmbE family N-acetylglucosaminyl deacetylase